MNPAKLQFSEEEKRLLQEPSWLLMKNDILRKIDEFLGLLGNDLQAQLNRELPDHLQEFLQLPPKLSRGEQYQGLPYRVLDFPRHFTRESIFAWRTLFWWGHFFTVTFHLRGSCLNTYAPQLIRYLGSRPEFSIHISLEGDEWNHDPRTTPLFSSKEPHRWLEQLQDASFCKFTRVVDLEPAGQLEAELFSCYRIFSESLLKA